MNFKKSKYYTLRKLSKNKRKLYNKTFEFSLFMKKKCFEI